MAWSFHLIYWGCMPVFISPPDNRHLFFHDAFKYLYVPTGTVWRKEKQADQRRLSLWAPTRMETSAPSEDCVCGKTHVLVAPQINQSPPHPAFEVPLCQTQLFPPLNEICRQRTEQAAMRRCCANVTAGGRLRRRKLFRGQRRPAVTPLDRETDSLVSAAWHLHNVKWPWRRGGAADRKDRRRWRTGRIWTTALIQKNMTSITD